MFILSITPSILTSGVWTVASRALTTMYNPPITYSYADGVSLAAGVVYDTRNPHVSPGSVCLNCIIPTGATTDFGSYDGFVWTQLVPLTGAKNEFGVNGLLTDAITTTMKNTSASLAITNYSVVQFWQ